MLFRFGAEVDWSRPVTVRIPAHVEVLHLVGGRTSRSVLTPVLSSSLLRELHIDLNAWKTPRVRSAQSLMLLTMWVAALPGRGISISLMRRQGLLSS